jgi:trehalose 6-phosphate phosphatase
MTPHWSEQRDALQEWLLTSLRILIGCDFDGTLAPLVSHADDARLPAATRAVLQRLAALPGVSLAFISGRALLDLQQRIDVVGALYAGNHGLEMTGADGATVLAPGAEEGLPALRRVKSLLAPCTTPMPGVWIEDKGLTLSVHYRLADESLHAEIEQVVRLAVAGTIPVVVRPAKCIWEIRPAIDWDKGAALRQFMQQQHVSANATAYMGDDVTDGDAFRELPDGWTFWVGADAGPTARAMLRDVQDCAALLEWMAEVRAAGHVPLLR